MKQIKTMEVIKKWAVDYCYSVKDISFGQDNQWLIIDLKAVTIILSDTKELMKDIRDYWSYATLYSVDAMPNDEGLSIWIQL